MSVIAVRGVPAQATVRGVTKKFTPIIAGKFKIMNFQPVKGQLTKLCYIKLDPNLDPKEIVRRFGKVAVGNSTMSAFIPSDMANVNKRKPARAKIPPNRPDIVIMRTLSEVLREMQTKYIGLYNLSNKLNHKLIDKLGEAIFDRLKAIVKMNEHACNNSFNLSKVYRKMHPHFADFQFILCNLHSIEDEMGKVRTQIVENDLMKVITSPYVIDNIPFNKVQEVCNRYSSRISKKITDHIKGLNTDQNDMVDTEQDTAQKKIRAELKKISPYIGMIIKQVFTKHLVPEETPVHYMRVYGEPFLPSKEVMINFVKKYKPTRIMRSEIMFNCLIVTISKGQYSRFITMDGTVLGGAKLVIRPSNVPFRMYNVKKSHFKLLQEMLNIDSDDNPEDFVFPDEAIRD